MAAGRHIKMCKNVNYSRTVRPILTKFGTELHPDTAQRPDGSKPPFFKIQPAKKLKFTKNWITSKRFVLYAPNLVCIMQLLRRNRNRNKPVVSKSQNSQSMMAAAAAILKFTLQKQQILLVLFDEIFLRAQLRSCIDHRMWYSRLFPDIFITNECSMQSSCARKKISWNKTK